jgi:hypothetical protein
MKLEELLNEGVNPLVGGEDITVETDYLKFYEGHKCGIKDKMGKIIVDCVYDDISSSVYSFDNQDFFIVANDGKMGALNMLGEIVVPVKYVSLEKVELVIQTHSY